MSEVRIEVGLGDRSYPIWIGPGLLPRIGEALSEVSFPKKLAIVTNEIVEPLYGNTLRSALENAGYEAHTIVLPDGEGTKTLQVLETIFDGLIESGIDRGCGLLALGGGVIGDIAGFAAASYMRGIPFVQVPTTLLAQVDSSVGGKTAVNHPLGKNLIGAFYQPKYVLIDVDTLKTLEKRDLAAGMAEVVKYGVIRDESFFHYLGENRKKVQDLVPETLVEIIKKSCQIKADIVENDEKEKGLRALLNFGHTYGHAVETLAGYGEYRHGEAVAIGMVVAAQVSRAFDLCSDEDVVVIRTLLADYDLPISPPEFPLDAVIGAMKRDKKVKAGLFTMVLNHGIGRADIHPVTDLEQLFEPFCG